MKKTIALSTLAIMILPTSLFAQQAVPVKKEPVHVTVFKNRMVTIMYPRLLPGDTSLFHIHEVPSAFLVMTNTRTYTQEKGSTGEISMSRKGETWYNDFQDKLIHRVGNSDNVEFRAIDIEFNNSPRSKDRNLIVGLDLPQEYERVRIYPVNVPAGSAIDIKLTANPIVLIPFNGNLFFREKGKNLPLKEGDIKWVEGSQALRIANPGLRDAEAYVYEVKR